MASAGVSPAGFPGCLMAGIDHGETDRVKHYAIKDRLLSQRINALYIRIKADMSRLVGVPMPLISYGGTSSVTMLLGFGVVMALKARRAIHR
jgi:hypothetical protein